MKPQPQRDLYCSTQGIENLNIDAYANKSRKSKPKLNLMSIMSELQLTPLMDDTSSAVSAPDDMNSPTSAAPTLPFRVLTKRNSKKWAIDHFDHYEKELK
eukprot:384138_1